jgi:hypothetical protein
MRKKFWTPERVAQLRELAGNVTAEELAHTLNTNRGMLYRGASVYGISLKIDKSNLRIVVPGTTAFDLREEAVARGMHVAELVRELLVAISTDKLYRAVLERD